MYRIRCPHAKAATDHAISSTMLSRSRPSNIYKNTWQKLRAALFNALVALSSAKKRTFMHSTVT